MEEGSWTTGESWGQNNQPNLKPMGRNRQWTIWTLESLGRTDGYMGVGRWVGGKEGQGYYILYKSVVWCQFPLGVQLLLKRESQWLLLVGTREDGRHDEEDTSKSGTSARLWHYTTHTHISWEEKKLYLWNSDWRQWFAPAVYGGARGIWLELFSLLSNVVALLVSISSLLSLFSRLSFGNDNQPLCPPFSKVKQIERKINMSLRVRA